MLEQIFRVKKFVRNRKNLLWLRELSRKKPKKRFNLNVSDNIANPNLRSQALLAINTLTVASNFDSINTRQHIVKQFQNFCCYKACFQLTPSIPAPRKTAASEMKTKHHRTEPKKKSWRNVLISLINSHLLNYIFLFFSLRTVQQKKLNWKHSACKSSWVASKRHEEIDTRANRPRQQLVLQWKAVFERLTSSRSCRSAWRSCRAVAMAAPGQSSASHRHQSASESSRKICDASSVTYLTSQGLPFATDLR